MSLEQILIQIITFVLPWGILIIFIWWFYNFNAKLEIYVEPSFFTPKVKLIFFLLGLGLMSTPWFFFGKDIIVILYGVGWFVLLSILIPILAILASIFLGGNIFGIIGGALCFIALLITAYHAEITLRERLRESGYGYIVYELESYAGRSFRNAFWGTVIYGLVFLPMYIYVYRRIVGETIKITIPISVSYSGDHVASHYKVYDVNLSPLRKSIEETIEEEKLVSHKVLISKEEPKDADGWYEKALALGNLGKYESAINCFDKALEINPKDANAWIGKGLALGNLGKDESAIECFDKALEINPRLAEAWYSKGLALGILGKYEEEIKCYDKALEINPRLAEAWTGKGIALDMLGDEYQAIQCLEQALRINPNYEPARKGLQMIRGY